MKQRNEIKSGVILSYVYLSIAMIAGLLYTPQMLKMMGQSEYGLYSIANSVISYLSFLGLGLESALIKYTAKYIALDDKESEQKLGGGFFRVYLIIAAVTLVCGFVLANNLGFLSQNLTATEASRLRIIVMIMTVNLAVSFPMGVFGAVITAHERFTFRKTIEIIREITLPITILIFLSMGYRAIGLVTIHTVFNFIVLALNYIYVRKVLEYKPIFAKFDIPLIKEITGYTVFVFIGTVVDRISDATNSMVIAAVSGAAAVAVFGVSLQIYGYYLNFSSSISTFFFPRVVGMTYKNASDEEVSDLFIKVGRVQLYVIALICSGFIVLGKDFINLWAGPEYYMAYYIIVVLMIPTLINRSQSLGTQILLARNKHKFRAILFLFVALLDIAVSIPLAMMWDGLGAAIGTFIATLIGPIITMNIYYSKKMHLDIKRYWKRTIPILLLVAVLVALGMLMNYFWKADNWAVLIAQVVIFTVVYSLSMYFIAFNDYEKELVTGFVSKLKRKKA